MILSDDMMTALITGRNALEIMWNREQVTRRELKTLRRMIIAALKWTWTLLTTPFIGKDKTKWGNIKSPIHIRSRWQKESDKITWSYWPYKESHYALRDMELSITGADFGNIFQHTNHYIFIIQPNFSRESNATLTKLRWKLS